MASSMEVQPSSSKDVSDTVLASSGSSGSVSVALHPLVIMNISEHYTRIKAQYGKPNPQGRFNKDCFSYVKLIFATLCTGISDVACSHLISRAFDFAIF